MMKKAFGILALFAVCLTASAKKVKVVVIPSTAKIYVDGSYYGDGTAIVNIKKNEGFVVLKLEEAGYATIETKFFATDTRKAVSYTMRKDPMYESTTENGNANKYFTVRVSKDLYSTGPDGKRDTELAWKMIHSVILNYFDEIQTTDIASGFVQTAWVYRKFPEVERVLRTRVSVKEASLGGDLTFQIRISSQVAPLRGKSNTDSYQDCERILKDIEPIINEFQTRLGKL